LQRTIKKQREIFSEKIDNYMREKRLPNSMRWAGMISVFWKDYFLNYAIEYIALLVGLFLIFFFTGSTKVRTWAIVYALIISTIWIVIRIGWKFFKATAMKQEIIIAKDGTLRERSPSQWTLVWRRYRKNRLALVSGAIVIVVTIIAIIYPLLVPFSPTGIIPIYDSWNGGGALSNPNLKYPGGTDILGRDEFSRILAGSEVSLTVGIFSTILSVIIGVTLGALAGYFRGWTEEIIMRLTDMFLALPFLVIAILAVSFIRRGRLVFLRQIPQSIVIIIVLGVFGWAGLCRLVSANTRQIYNLDYVNAARVLGASNRRIIMIHILPNILAPIIVIGTLAIAGGILSEAGLTFLGLGSPTTISWGQMVNEAQTVLKTNPELALLPGFAIFFVVLAFNLLGDALRDALDPRLRE
jgi:ABC-type dipeptide/oligopeptide/nickel transport system permease subunit